MDALKIIEKLEHLKEGIGGAFEKGQIDFDEIVGELDSISNELRSRERTGEALRQSRQKSSEIHSTIDPRDFN